MPILRYILIMDSINSAENIPGAKFIGFETGGHLLIGQEEEVRSEVVRFIKEHLTAGERTKR